MKALFFTILIILLTGIIGNSQGLITVQNGSSVSFYTTVPLAVDNAINGDTIYIPAGGFTLNSLNKKLHLVGIGYNNVIGTEGISILSSQIELQPNSSGSSLTGLKIDGKVILSSVNNINISRCNIQGGIFGSGPISNILISECLLGASDLCFTCSNPFSVALSNSTNIYFSNNIALSKIALTESVIKNNILLSTQQFFDNLQPNNCIVENNIIKGSIRGQNSIYKNNFLLSSPSGQGNQESNDYINGNINNLFINPIFFNNSSLALDANYNIITNSIYYTGGSDGTQIGLYGGPYIWKDGAIPFNPTIQSKQIANFTDQNGNLKINIKVKAQNN